VNVDSEKDICKYNWPCTFNILIMMIMKFLLSLLNQIKKFIVFLVFFILELHNMFCKSELIYITNKIKDVETWNL